MCSTPDVQAIINQHSEQSKALINAIKEAQAGLNNDKDTALAYIEKNTAGIIPGTMSPSNFNSYNRFAEDFSLAGLAPIITDSMNIATDAVKVDAGDESAIPDLIKSIGGVITSVLDLFNTSSTSTTQSSISFFQFQSHPEATGARNWAVYNCCNSATLEASAWGGSKNVIVVQNSMAMVECKVNEQVTLEENYQSALDTLAALVVQYNQQLLNATTEAEMTALALYKTKLDTVTSEVKALKKQAEGK